MILDAARTIIEAEGLGKLSAREIAREIGYAPGTLYNMFENLDEIILHVEGLVLADLDQHLEARTGQAIGAEGVRAFARAYIEFARANPLLWSLIDEYPLEAGAELPTWYVERITAPIRRLEASLAPLLTQSDPAVVRQSTAAVWSFVHGWATHTISRKLSCAVPASSAGALEHLIDTYLAGLSQQAMSSEGGKRRARGGRTVTPITAVHGRRSSL